MTRLFRLDRLKATVLATTLGSAPSAAHSNTSRARYVSARAASARQKRSQAPYSFPRNRPADANGCGQKGATIEAPRRVSVTERTAPSVSCTLTSSGILHHLPGLEQRRLHHFKRAALCARGTMDGVERFFIALAALGFAGLFATFIWIVLVWFGVLAVS
jgi:hypothetical protein